MKLTLRRHLSFHQKLLLAFVVLLTLAGVASAVAISYSSQNYFNRAILERLDTGREVARNYLANREQQLAVSVGVLVNDFGFKAAVATRDVATIDSVLANHGARIGADLVALADLEGNIISATAPNLAGTRMRWDSTGVQRLGEQLYKVFVRPVEVPDHIGWVTMAFRMDYGAAWEIAKLTSLHVTFADLTHPEASLISSRPDLTPQQLRAELSPAAADSSGYLSETTPLNETSSDLVLVLQATTNDIHSAATQLTEQLVGIFAVALSACLLVGMWLARRISNPVATLIEAAKRIRRGVYDQPVSLDAGGEIGILGAAINTMVDGIVAREEKISGLAFNEPVTGLPNRTRFVEQFDHDQVEHGALNFCVALFHLQDHKDVDFSYGAHIGDQFRHAAAVHLQAHLLHNDQIYAFSAQNLAIVMFEPDEAEAQRRARHYGALLQTRLSVDEWEIGSAVASAFMTFPQEASSITELLQRLESTLARAQDLNELNLNYLAEEEAVRRRQLQLISGFETAFREHQFFLVFQPKIDLASHTVVEAEALLRWVHPDLGFVPPDEFIVLAERSANIGRLTQWVLRRTLQQLAAWNREAFHIRLAVNVSPQDLSDPDFCPRLQSMMQEYGVEGRSLTLEVTENAVITNPTKVLSALIRLKRLGIQLAIDDFGTGFSSLSQLKSLPFDELKIDKSFVLELDQSSEDLQIVHSTIELGHNLGLKVVAEGVENQQSLDLLSSYGCDKVQGFFFSKPREDEDFKTWCQTFNERTQNPRKSA